MTVPSTIYRVVNIPALYSGRQRRTDTDRLVALQNIAQSMSIVIQKPSNIGLRTPSDNYSLILFHIFMSRGGRHF